MAHRAVNRRAALYRQRANILVEMAAAVRDAPDRRYLMDLAETFKRTADNLVPEPVASEAQSIFRRP